jgi:hypothetical protein
MSDATYSPTLTRSPLAEIALAVDAVADAVTAYCTEQGVALSVDHYFAVEDVVNAVVDLQGATERLHCTLGRISAARDNNETVKTDTR